MSFQTHEKQGLLWLTSESLALGGVVHGFSTRRGGVSAPPCDSLNLGLARGDEDACVRENYRRFRRRRRQRPVAGAGLHQCGRHDLP